MDVIMGAYQALNSMTHTELMLTGIFACLFIQTLFLITGRLRVQNKIDVARRSSFSSVDNRSDRSMSKETL